MPCGGGELLNGHALDVTRIRHAVTERGGVPWMTMSADPVGPSA